MLEFDEFLFDLLVFLFVVFEYELFLGVYYDVFLLVLMIDVSLRELVWFVFDSMIDVRCFCFSILFDYDGEGFFE